MSLFSEFVRDAERAVKKAVRKNPLLGKLIKFAKGLLDVYEAMYPGTNLVEAVTAKVRDAEKKYEKKLEGFLTGKERHAWVMAQLRKVRLLKDVPEHVLLTVIQQVVTLTPRKVDEEVQAVE